MALTPKTKYVFLDTQVFKSHTFNYQSPNLKRLAELVAGRHVVVLLTSITVNEVKANIAKDVAEGITALNTLWKTHAARIFINVSKSFEDISNRRPKKDEVVSELIQQFENYCMQIGAEVLTVDGPSIEEVFAKYFSASPPFAGAGKKAEFPDAFVIATLKQWCERNKTSLYVISGDEGIVSSCDGAKELFALRDLADFLDIATKHLELKRYKVGKKVFTFCLPHIKLWLEEGFPEIGFFLDEAEGEVLDVAVDQLNIVRWNMVAVEDYQATYELLVKFDYRARVSYAETSFANGMYFDYREEELPRSLESKVIVVIAIDIEHLAKFELQEVNIEERDVLLNLWGDPFDYK